MLRPLPHAHTDMIHRRRPTTAIGPHKTALLLQAIKDLYGTNEEGQTE
jgi:hypothetical protein